MNRIALINPLRTSMGSFGGSLASLSAPQLGQKVIEACAGKSGMSKEFVDEVYMGNVLQAGNGQNPARQAAMNAGIPINVPATTVNTVCGSGLHAVMMASNAILAGQIEVAVAGGMESMSNAPYLLKKGRNGYRLGNGEIIDSLVSDGLTCPFNSYHMGITAENIAKKYNITRVAQDEFAYLSQMKATEAKNSKKLDSEIVSITIKTKKEEINFKDDEYIKENTTIEKLSTLRTAFDRDGTVTAGNASGINDGAAGMVVLSENKCKEIGINPMFFIKGYSLVGLEPAYMGMGPLYAVNDLIKKTGVDIKDIDIFELNEAFAAQSIAVVNELGIDSQRVNVNGGAIAYGHPIGASGARILVTLMHEMHRTNKRYGIASLCIGTGMGIALMVENPNV